MPRRRLTGIAALSAAALATASTAVPGVAADDCDAPDCDPQIAAMRQMIEAFAGDDIPEAAMDQVMATFAEMWLSQGGDAFLKLGDLAESDAFLKLGDLAESDAFLKLGDLAESDAFLKLGDLAESDAFLKLGDLAESDAFLKLGDLAESDAFLKLGQDLDDLFSSGDAAFPKVEDLDAATLEAMLLQIADAQDLDPAMIKLILDQLPEE